MAGGVGEATVVLGPVLYFRGEQGERWRLSALFVLDGEAEPEDLTVDGVRLPVPPRHVASWRGRHVWRFDFAVPRGGEGTEVAYGFAGAPGTWRVAVPALGQRPHVAYTSCNGVEDPRTLGRFAARRDALWVALVRRHAESPFHLLLQGGDQLYADAVWHDCPSLASWRRQREAVRRKAPFTAAMAEEAMDFYFDLYLAHWSRPEVAEALSRIPSIMMWDDHDIFDGWGSLPEPVQAAKVPRGVYLVARRHFALFQLGTAMDSPPECVWGSGGMTQGFRVADVGILVPDLRSERTPHRILSDQSWEALPRWLERFEGCRHLLLLSSVPFVFPDLSGVERFLERLPFRIGYEDDLRDQWRSYAHDGEWRRLVELLAGFARRTACRVTALSGEIHLGGCGVLRAPGAEIVQLIASGIVHPPPHLFARFLELMSRTPESPDDGTTLAMLPFRESGHRYINARNWLELDFAAGDRLDARWHVEDAAAPWAKEF